MEKNDENTIEISIEFLKLQNSVFKKIINELNKKLKLDEQYNIHEKDEQEEKDKKPP